MGQRYDNILGTIGNTPVVRINALAPANVNLYVKIEAFNPLGSVKDRLALGVIEEAEQSGELKPGQTVIEATCGNTGIGLAMVCAQKGYPLVVTMAESFSVERRRLMRFLGADVVLTPAIEKGTGMVSKAAELAKTHSWYLTPQFENEANPDIHSKTTAVEILADFDDTKLDYWVTGFGTGGTLKGVARVLKKESPDTKIMVCEPADAPMLTDGSAQERNADGSPYGWLDAVHGNWVSPALRARFNWRYSNCPISLAAGNMPGRPPAAIARQCEYQAMVVANRDERIRRAVVAADGVLGDAGTEVTLDQVWEARVDLPDGFQLEILP